MAVYAYSEDRKGEHPAGHLVGFQGVLQVDGYAPPAALPPAASQSDRKRWFKRLAGDRADISGALTAQSVALIVKHYADATGLDRATSPSTAYGWAS